MNDYLMYSYKFKDIFSDKFVFPFYFNNYWVTIGRKAPWYDVKMIKIMICLIFI